MQLRIRPQQRLQDETRYNGSVPGETLGCHCGGNQALNKERQPGYDIGVENADVFPVPEPQDLQTKKEENDI